jgi:hypothetical protein
MTYIPQPLESALTRRNRRRIRVDLTTDEYKRLIAALHTDRVAEERRLASLKRSEGGRNWRSNEMAQRMAADRRKQDLDLARELHEAYQVVLDEERAADEIEETNLRGIVAPDY